VFPPGREASRGRRLLTPKNGTGKRLTSGPSLVMKYHSARKNLLRGLGKRRLRSAMRCRLAKGLFCAFEGKFSVMHGDVARYKEGTS
jgi:hypothetical protein